MSTEKKGVMLDRSQPISKNTSPKQQDVVKNAEQQGRKITYKATVSVDVDNYPQFRTKLEDLASKSQGYLVDSNENQSRKKTLTGTFTYRIPQKNFQTFINNLKTVSSDRASINIKGNDVTETMVDLNSRLKAKKATEARLLELMSKSTDSSTLLQISRQLDSTQVEIEEIQGRLHYLNHRVDFSEITVTLRQDVGVSAPDNASMVEKMKESFIDSSMGIFNMGKNLLIFLAGAIPVLIVLSVILIPIYLWIRKRRQAKKQKQTQQKTE